MSRTLTAFALLLGLCIVPVSLGCTGSTETTVIDQEQTTPEQQQQEEDDYEAEMNQAEKDNESAGK